MNLMKPWQKRRKPTMNKVMRAVLAALLMVSLLAAHSVFAEAMIVEAPTASDPVAASLPDEYLEGLEGLEEIITQESEPEITEEPTAAPTAVPIPTEEPMETESPYTVSFVLPNGWTNTAKATVTIRITDSGNIGLQQAEYSLGNGWNDLHVLQYQTAADAYAAYQAWVRK